MYPPPSKDGSPKESRGPKRKSAPQGSRATHTRNLGMWQDKNNEEAQCASHLATAANARGTSANSFMYAMIVRDLTTVFLPKEEHS